MPVAKTTRVSGRLFRLVAERNNPSAARGLAKKIRMRGAAAVVRRRKTSWIVYARSRT